jgi:hypothetical protein
MSEHKRLQIHPLGILIIVLSAASWLIALGGVSSSQQLCSEAATCDPSEGKDMCSIQCAKQYQWEWFGLFFEAGMLISIFFTAFSEKAYVRGRLILLLYLLLATVVVMLAAHNFISGMFLGRISFNLSDRAQAAFDAGAAGYTLLACSNFCLIIILGVESPPAVPEKIEMGSI